MATYIDNDYIRSRVEYEGEDFYDLNPSNNFDNLLTKLEAESRSIIENHKGDVTFNEEIGKEETFTTPSGSRLQLKYPVNQVKDVEVRRFVDDSFTSLESDRYKVSNHSVILRKFPKASGIPQVYSHRNQLSQNIRRIKWENIAEEVRVTYDRGFSEIPDNIKSIQVTIINRLLRQLKNEQNIQALSPEDAARLPEREEVLTEELRERLNNVTNFSRNVVAL